MAEDHSPPIKHKSQTQLKKYVVCTTEENPSHVHVRHYCTLLPIHFPLPPSTFHLPYLTTRNTKEPNYYVARVRLPSAHLCETPGDRQIW